MAGYFGIYRGVVLSANDPSGRGRVQVMVPAVSGDGSGWAQACQPGGAPAQPPKVGDTAWVMFEGGNPSLPVYMGTG